ncbi:MAG: hypothetical protein KME35_17720 [Aphanocapsa sp. GSE-SYN-MK-11-07L]|jgi:hypothetical protein|nr:hypothetical protein [Aphanocapsa sp. GSE-SYN-MK-11-07L]
MPKIPILLSSLALVFLADAAQAGSVTGSWAYDGPSQSGLWLKTEQTGNTVRFQLELSKGAPSYNSGWVEGQFKLEGAVGVFESDEYGACEITFKFTQTSVQVEQSQERSECGFGNNVQADGTLDRKSEDQPKFSNGDPRVGAQ